MNDEDIKQRIFVLSDALSKAAVEIRGGRNETPKDRSMIYMAMSLVLAMVRRYTVKEDFEDGSVKEDQKEHGEGRDEEARPEKDM